MRLEDKRGMGYAMLIRHKRTMKLIRKQTNFLIGIPIAWYRKWEEPEYVVVKYEIRKNKRIIIIYREIHESIPEEWTKIKRSDAKGTGTHYIELDMDFLNNTYTEEEMQGPLSMQLNFELNRITIEIPVDNIKLIEKGKANIKKRQSLF